MLLCEVAPYKRQNKSLFIRPGLVPACGGQWLNVCLCVCILILKKWLHCTEVILEDKRKEAQNGNECIKVDARMLLLMPVIPP